MAAYAMLRGAGVNVDPMLDQLERGAADSGMATAMYTMLDTGSYGAADTLAQGRAQAGAIANGASPEEAAEAGQAAQARINENLSIARTNYPGWAIAGDAAGFVAGGGPVNAAYNLALRSSRYGFRSTVAAPAFTGATEAGLYRANSDGTWEEVQRDASLGFAFGAIGGAVIGGASGLLGRFRSSNESLRYEVGNEIYQTMAATARSRGETLTPQQAAAQLQNAGDQFLTDMYPELTPILRRVAGSDNPGVQDLTANFIRMRNGVDFNYRDEVLNVLRSGERPMRTERQFADYVDTRQAELSPRYDALFSGVENQTVPVNDFIQQMTNDLFNRDLATYANDNAAVREAFASVLGQPGRRPNQWTANPRQIFEVRKELRRRLRSRMQGNTTGMTYQSPDNLRAAIDGIDSYLNSLPIGDDLRHLNSLYGNLEEAQDAFTLGQQVVTRRNIVAEDVPDIQRTLAEGASERAARANDTPASQQVINDIGLVLGEDLSAEVLNAFVDGARFQLYAAARNTRDPSTALSNVRMEDFRAIVGDDIADAMAENIEALTAREVTTRAAQQGAAEGPAGRATQSGVSPLQNLADFSIIGQYLRGNATGVAPAFAARRQLGQTQPLTTTIPRQEAIRADAMMTPASGTAADLVGRTVPGTSRTAPGVIGGLAGGAGVGTGEPMQETYDAISQQLEGVPPMLRDALVSEWRAMQNR
jgi:hypothetical protein